MIFPNSVHISGAGGIGTSGLAILFQQLGCRVTATDQRESEITSLLKNNGIQLDLVPHPEWAASAHLVVTPNIFPEDHPEIRQARENNIPVLSRTEALLDLCRSQNCKITICCGTISRALCAASIAQSSSDFGFCLGLAQPNQLHAKFAHNMIIDIDERELVNCIDKLSGLNDITLIVSDWSDDALKYYNKSFSLDGFIDRISSYVSTIIYPRTAQSEFVVRNNNVETVVPLKVDYSASAVDLHIGSIDLRCGAVSPADISAYAAASLYLNQPAPQLNPIGWMQKFDELRTFDIRMHPVSIKNAIRAVSLMSPAEPITVVIKPFSSTLNAYDENVWRKAFTGAQTIYVMTPGYGASDKDCRRLATALKMRGLCAAAYPKKQLLAEFKSFAGRQLWIGAPDMLTP